MMRSINIGEGQTLIDVAMQHLGDASRVFEIMELNELGLTDEPAPGTTLLIPDVAVDRQYVVDAFAKKGLVPASTELETAEETDEEGIDYWAIEDDFEVQ